MKLLFPSKLVYKDGAKRHHESSIVNIQFRLVRISLISGDEGGLDIEPLTLLTI
jgi:hypothetical protein